MMNKNTAILDNTMMDAYLTVTEGVSDNCGIGLAFASLLESARRTLSTRATAALSMQALPADLLQFAG